MKNMQKFAAQQLSKTQMIDITGGMYDVECTYRSYDGVTRKVYARGSTPNEALNGAVEQMQGSYHTGVRCIWG